MITYFYGRPKQVGVLFRCLIEVGKNCLVPFVFKLDQKMCYGMIRAGKIS